MCVIFDCNSGGRFSAEFLSTRPQDGRARVMCVNGHVRISLCWEDF